MGTHRYSKIGYVALNVSDLERSRRFYEELWGLQFAEAGPQGELFFRCGEQHHHLVLHAGGQPGLKRIGWEMEAESDLDSLATALSKQGIAVREVDAGERAVLRQGRSIRFSDPFTGATHECYTSMQELIGKPFAPRLARMRRVGHVVMKTPRYDEAVRFYLEVLNFRASDVIDGMITFMRCFPNPAHHSFALMKSDRASLHHVNFVVDSFDDIGAGYWRFKRSEVPVVWGPGRHPTADCVFLYVLDPDGITVEYSDEMEQFPEQGARKARVLPPSPDSVDAWAGPVDPRLGATGAIEGTGARDS